MKGYYKLHEWKIIEEGFSAKHHEASESIFSIGNGSFGQRANFEEKYSGKSLRGSYVGGVYYPDKTRVGWWKNGYPEYFAKVLNAPNWIGINLTVNNQEVDLNTAKVLQFTRELNMQKGYLNRHAIVELTNGNQIEINSLRFCSLKDIEVGMIKYSVKALNFSGNIQFEPFVDADVVNKDSNYDEKFWDEVSQEVKPNKGYVVAKTKKTEFIVSTGMQVWASLNGEEINLNPQTNAQPKYISNTYNFEVNQGDEITLFKAGTYVSSFNHAPEKLQEITYLNLQNAQNKGFDTMLAEQAKAWEKRWEFGDIKIEGDLAAQQGIRFNIFQLHQTYTGDDARLNIGPKGFTGEKYGGSTYWDTEAYCFQFYLSTAGEKVAEQLLKYRHNHLQKAIENAEKLGFKNGAALYPMVTMNGEECHNEWEITFEEIHRNGAIAYAIYNYANYTQKTDYLYNDGLDVLVGISRFWAQRVNYSEQKKKYVMLGVTGPNEYENNVNNNWYTNYIAAWCLRFTSQTLEELKHHKSDSYHNKTNQLKITPEEIVQWQNIIANIYFPYDDEKQVFLQQEGFLDKDLTPVSELNPQERPLNQHWSWDRILRSCYIKQGDVLQGLYFFEHEFKHDEIERNFNFYEPLTVHESSLSPCVHSILATYLGKNQQAYEFYLRTARLDLDDYNKEVHEGLHITSMAGTWLSVVEGFGGMRVKNNQLHLTPIIPDHWKSYSFNILFRGHAIKVNVQSDGVYIHNHAEEPITIVLHNQLVELVGEEFQFVAR